jgi:hypothetical protein
MGVESTWKQGRSQEHRAPDTIKDLNSPLYPLSPLSTGSST